MSTSSNPVVYTLSVLWLGADQSLTGVYSTLEKAMQAAENHFNAFNKYEPDELQLNDWHNHWDKEEGRISYRAKKTTSEEYYVVEEVKIDKNDWEEEVEHE